MINHKIILASASLGRKKILSDLHIPFDILPSLIDENIIIADKPKDLVLKRARAKGQEVEKRLDGDYLIISADSMAVFRNQLIGKIYSKSQQKMVLRKLAGNTHSFITGVWIKNTKNHKEWLESMESKVTIGNVSDKDIEKYVNADDLSKYAGSYSLDTIPKGFNLQVYGSITNVIGLPLEILLPVLKENKII